MFKKLLVGATSFKKVLLACGGIGGAPVIMLSDAAIDSKAPREWKFEFFDGQMINVDNLVAGGDVR